MRALGTLVFTLACVFESLAFVGCGGEDIHAPRDLVYERKVGTTHFTVWFPDRSVMKTRRVDDVKPGANEMTYEFATPITWTGSLTFAFGITAQAVTGRFLDTGEWLTVEGDTPGLNRYRGYRLRFEYPHPASQVEHQGYCCY